MKTVLGSTSDQKDEQGIDGDALPLEFYLQPTLDVAKALIGRLLLRYENGGILAGRIVETEAYTAEDPSSHAFRGLSRRNAAMFGPPAHTYVYLIYGMHYCLNIVTAPEGTAEAVLIRAVEPTAGVEMMRRRRASNSDRDLTAGPSRLCQAFGIDLSLNNTDLIHGSELRILAGPGPKSEIKECTRIGLSHKEASTYLWRFVEANNPFLSRPCRS